MAKGNMLQGQATGKVGDIVFMVRNGQQVARVYTSAGGRSGDQASIAVRRQRVRFGAASNQYLLYRNIIRGMYRTGKNTKQSDYNYFVRENVDLLPFLTREENAAGVKCVMPGTFSRGTLGSLIYNLEASLTAPSTLTFGLVSPNGVVAGAFELTDTVAKAKEELQKDFPNARKVNFCICRINERLLELPGGQQYTQEISRNDVIFDLFQEDPEVPDTATVLQYYQAKLRGSEMSTLLAASTAKIYGNGSYFSIELDNATLYEDGLYLYANVFATNDQVGDCYTTMMLGIEVPWEGKGLDLYNTLRTDDHRQVAEDSYGYATGVMRTDIQQA